MSDKVKEQVERLMSEIKGGNLGTAVRADFLQCNNKLVGLRISTETPVASAIIGLEHGIESGCEAYSNNKPYKDFVFDLAIYDCNFDYLKQASKVAGKGFGIYEMILDAKGENFVTLEESKGLQDYDVREIEDKELRTALLKCVISQGENIF